MPLHGEAPSLLPGACFPPQPHPRGGPGCAACLQAEPGWSGGLGLWQHISLCSMHGVFAGTAFRVPRNLCLLVLGQHPFIHLCGGEEPGPPAAGAGSAQEEPATHGSQGHPDPSLLLFPWHRAQPRAPASPPRHRTCLHEIWISSHQPGVVGGKDRENVHVNETCSALP